MSDKSYEQAQRDAASDKAARDTQNDHWKARQDYNAGYAAEKNKRV